MVGKATKKKTLVDTTANFALQPASDMSFCLALVEHGSRPSLSLLYSIFVELQAKSNRQEQNRLFQSNKRKLKESISALAWGEEPAEASERLIAMLRLYIEPQYDFQSSLEWILPALKELYQVHSESVLSVVAEFCANLLYVIYKECIDVDQTTAFLERVTYWIPAINGLTNINHEIGWLLAERAPTLSFFQFIVRLTGAQMQAIQSDDSVTTLSSRISKTMDDNLRCLIRNTNSVFQSLKQKMAQSNSSEWQGIVTEIRRTVSQLLSLSSPHLFSDKDIISAASSLYISLFLYNSNTENVTFQLVVHNLNCSDLVQACLFKALLHLYESMNATYLLDDALQAILRQCQHHDCEVQLLGLQTMETWAFRVKDVMAVPTNESAVQVTALMDTFMKLILMLITLWDHPVRQINHLVPSIFEKMLRFISAELLTTAPAANFWSQLFDRCMQMGSHYRGKYQALRIVLTISGDQAILNLPSGFMMHVVQATQTRDIAAAVSFLVAALCDLTSSSSTPVPSSANSEKAELQPASEEVIKAKCVFLQELLEAIVKALCSDNETLRKNISDYILPVIFKTYPGYALRLLQIWIHQAQSSSRTSEGGFTKFESWALIQLIVHCRQLFPQLLTQLDTVSSKDSVAVVDSSSQSLLSEKDAKLVSSVLQAAYQSENDDMRFTALTSIVASLKVAAPISVDQFNEFIRHVVYSLKTSDAENVQHLARILRIILPRLKPQGQNKSFLVMKSLKMNIWEQELFNHLSQALYPGITQDTECAVLSLLHHMIEHFSSSSNSASTVSGSTDAEIDSKQEKEDSYFVSRLLQTYQSDWDKSRDVAVQIMEKIACPWPGFESPESLRRLLQTSTQLAMKAKLRESDAGAKLLRSLYRCYALRQNVDLSENVDTSVESDSSLSATTAAEKFILVLVSHIQNAMNTLNSIFAMFLQQGHVDLQQIDVAQSIDNGEFPLVHGLLLSLRLIVEVTMKEASGPSVGSVVGAAKQRLKMLQGLKAVLLQTAQQCFASGLSIVAEYVSDDLFSPANNNAKNHGDSDGAMESAVVGSSPAAVVAKGPINSATGISMAAVYVNTNTFTMDVNDMANSANGSSVGDARQGADPEAIQRTAAGLAAQRAIVAAWLLVKESSALFATLVDVSPTPSTTDDKSEEFLSSEEIADISWSLLDALGRLKHMGAIAETHVALQTIVARILRFSSPVPLSILQLPNLLLNSLLDRLRHRQQVFILRRSAGFAYSFLSILRAEPANASAPLLHAAMSNLIDIVKRGLSTSVITARDVSEQEDDDWKLSVHALNVLRLIILDGAFSFELDRYISPLLMLTISGFAHNEWAVRNSSMMVFSAIVQKCVAKDKNSSTKGHTSNNNSSSSSGGVGSAAAAGALSVSAREFFRRYPGIDEFLVRRLSENTTNRASVRDEHCLYPLLLLFAKFQAVFSSNEALGLTTEAAAVATNAHQTHIDQLTSIIRQRYLGHASLAIRQVAARALSALIPISQIPIAIESLMVDIFPSNVIQKASASELKTAARSAKKDRPAATIALTINELHGRLLVILELLQVFHFYVLRHRYDASSVALEGSEAGSESRAAVNPVGYIFQQLQGMMSKTCLSKVYDSILLRLQCPLLQSSWLGILGILKRLQLQNADAKDSSIDTRVNDYARGVYHLYHQLAKSQPQTFYLRECFLGDLMRQVLPIVLQEGNVSVEIVFSGLSSPVKEIREGVIAALLAPSCPLQPYSAVSLIDTVTKSMLVESDAVLQERLWLLLVKLLSNLSSNGTNRSGDVEREDDESGEGVLESEEDDLQVHPSLLSHLHGIAETSMGVSQLDGGQLKALEMLCWRQIYMQTVGKADFENIENHRHATLQPRQCVASAITVLQFIFSFQLTKVVTAASLDSTSASSVLSNWLHLLEKASDAENTQVFRLAAARAFVQSPLLAYLSFKSSVPLSVQSEYLVRSFCLLMRLLQDDDHDVRASANLAAHYFLCTLHDIHSAGEHTTSSGSMDLWAHVAGQLFANDSALGAASLLRALPPIVVCFLFCFVLLLVVLCQL